MLSDSTILISILITNIMWVLWSMLHLSYYHNSDCTNERIKELEAKLKAVYHLVLDPPIYKNFLVELVKIVGVWDD